MNDREAVGSDDGSGEPQGGEVSRGYQISQLRIGLLWVTGLFLALAVFALGWQIVDATTPSTAPIPVATPADTPEPILTVVQFPPDFVTPSVARPTPTPKARGYPRADPTATPRPKPTATPTEPPPTPTDPAPTPTRPIGGG